MVREIEREKARRETDGTNWETLLGLFEHYVGDELTAGRWVQSRQTADEAMRSLHNWTKHWFKEAAARISPSDVTKLFHQMKEKECSDSSIAKLRGNICILN